MFFFSLFVFFQRRNLSLAPRLLKYMTRNGAQPTWVVECRWNSCWLTVRLTSWLVGKCGARGGGGGGCCDLLAGWLDDLLEESLSTPPVRTTIIVIATLAICCMYTVRSFVPPCHTCPQATSTAMTYSRKGASEQAVALAALYRIVFSCQHAATTSFHAHYHTIHLHI